MKWCLIFTNFTFIHFINGVGTWQNVWGGGHIWRAQHRDASHAKVTSQISVGSMPRPKFWVWKWGGAQTYLCPPPLKGGGGGTCPPVPTPVLYSNGSLMITLNPQFNIFICLLQGVIIHRKRNVDREIKHDERTWLSLMVGAWSVTKWSGYKDGMDPELCFALLVAAVLGGGACVCVWGGGGGGVARGHTAWPAFNQCTEPPG